MEETLKNEILDWVHECDMALYDYMMLTQACAQSDKWDDEQGFSIGSLFTACMRSSGSVLILLEHLKIWDAEILMRSVYEGTIKSAYLLACPDKFNERHHEFSDALFDIEQLKQHKKAKDLLATLKDPHKRKWQPIRDILLPDEKIKETQENYPRKERQKIEQKWGFTGLISNLTQENLPAPEMFPMLLHPYSMASHYMHADYTGVSTAMERELRGPEDRDVTNHAHALRIISDLFWLSYLRVSTAYKFLKIDPAPLKKLNEKYANFSGELSEYPKT